MQIVTCNSHKIKTENRNHTHITVAEFKSLRLRENKMKVTKNVRYGSRIRRSPHNVYGET